MKNIQYLKTTQYIIPTKQIFRRWLSDFYLKNHENMYLATLMQHL